MIARKSIPEVSRETLTIEKYLSEKKPGDKITYREIEKNTGIKMDQKGRSYLRTALNRLGLETLTIWNEGIQLVNEDTAMTKVVHRLVSIDKAVKRGEKSHKRIHNQFYDKLTPVEKQQTNFVGAIFSAIRQSAKSGKVLLANPMKALQPTPPVLPETAK